MACDGAARGRPPKRPASGGLAQPNVVTYKRRRRGTGANAGHSAVTSGPDPAKNQMSAVVHAIDSQQGGRQTLGRHWRSWRDTLEGVLQSTAGNQGSGGIQSCIRDALRYSGCHATEHGNLADDRGAGRDDPVGAVHSEENSGALVQLEDGTAASLEANKAMCHNALFDILISEKFAMLCDLLAATFHVSKPDDVIGLQIIDAKMRNGDYAQNPALLDHDIKQILKKFEHVGQEMAGLASSLSVISQASHQKQASGVSEIDVAEHKIEETSLVGVARKTLRELTPPCDSGYSTIPKRAGRSGSDGICKDCGRKADSKGRIICDRCEAAYHVSCLKLAIDEEAPAKWYCPTCAEPDIPLKHNEHGRSHEGCDVCEWLVVEKPEEPAEDVSEPELAVKTQESSVSSMDEDSEPDLSTTALANLCKSCGTCEDENKTFMVCGHGLCSFKFYHVLCLKESQIASEKQKNLKCWYCPSCLCRRCFKDKDDEKIVLCDGCDEAYHIYCMDPPCESVPRGKWFCTRCSARRSERGMQRYEKSILEKVKRAPGAKGPPKVQASAALEK